MLGEAGSWVRGAQELTLPFGLLLRLFGIFPNKSNTASVGGKQWVRAAWAGNCGTAQQGC